MVADATDVPSQNNGNGTFTFATWNIRCGQNRGFERVLRALESMYVDIAILTESELTKKVYTDDGYGYQVFVTNAVSAHQGGLALCNWQNNHYDMEKIRKHGVNFITFQLMTEDKYYCIVVTYVPPPTSGPYTIFGILGSSALREACHFFWGI